MLKHINVQYFILFYFIFKHSAQCMKVQRCYPPLHRRRCSVICAAVRDARCDEETSTSFVYADGLVSVKYILRKIKFFITLIVSGYLDNTCFAQCALFYSLGFGYFRTYQISPGHNTTTKV